MEPSKGAEIRPQAESVLRQLAPIENLSALFEDAPHDAGSPLRGRAEYDRLFAALARGLHGRARHARIRTGIICHTAQDQPEIEPSRNLPPIIVTLTLFALDRWEA